jgi:hypothetical protein
MPINVDDLNLPLRGSKGWDVPFKAAVVELVDLYNGQEAATETAVGLISGAVDTNDAVLAAAIADSGSATQAAAGALFSRKGDLFFRVEDYRASGFTDTQTVRAAIQAAAAAGVTFEHPVVLFGPRQYDITDTGIFSDLGKTSQIGMRFQGQGRTRLRLITGGAEKWFFDNGATSRLSYASWADIEFYTDDTTRTFGNGFKFTSTGHEKNYTFERCHFMHMNEVFACYGSVNADSIRLAPGCRMVEINTALRLENNQAVLMEWYSVNIELCRKNMFVIGTGGGGDIKLYGGSLIMENAAGDVTPYYLLSVATAPNVGTANARSTFQGIKTELRSQTTGLVSALGASGAVTVAFVDSNLFTTGALITPHTAVQIGNRRRVSFRNTTLSPNHNYVLDVASGAAPGENESLIDFVDCEVPDDLSDMVSWVQATRYGRVRAVGSRLISANPAVRRGVDFDLNWRNSGQGGPGIPTKRATFHASVSRRWPDLSGQEWSVKLPKDAIISRIVVQRPAVGSSVTPFALKVGTDDKATVYATSTSASGQFKDKHTIDVLPMVDAGSATNTRTVRLWADALGDNTFVAGGWAWVEYV